MELLFESRTNLTSSGKLNFFQRQPEIHPDPVLTPDCFVDDAGASLYGTILQDGGVYRMWYQAWPRDWDGKNCELVGYAESDNGIDWRKPELGLVDYAGDGADNNLVDMRAHSPSLFIDPEAPPSHRYRATMCTDARSDEAPAGLQGRGYFTAHSADGLKWEYDQATPQWNHADVITSIYHPGRERGIVALKQTPFFNGIPRRSIWQAQFRDGQWSEAHAALVPDEYDDITAGARGFVSGDYYGMGMMPAGNGTVGFIWQFRHNMPRTTGIGTGVFGVVDVSLAYQAEHGDRWIHLPGRPDFIAHDDPAFGGGCIYTASRPIEVGDEQWLYFSAFPRTHGWYSNEEWEIDEELKQTLIDEGMYRIGVARWPKWRLFGFHSDPRGTLDINLGRLSEPAELHLNYRCESGGSIRAELLNHDQHNLEQAVALTGDELHAPVAWTGGSGLPVNPGADSTVRLHLDRAEVYAYELVNPAG